MARSPKLVVLLEPRGEEAGRFGSEADSSCEFILRAREITTRTLRTTRYLPRREDSALQINLPVTLYGSIYTIQHQREVSGNFMLLSSERPN